MLMLICKEETQQKILVNES